MLTEEQQHVVDEVLSNDERIITVNSIAGSGKTSTGEAVIKAFKPKHGFYTAFNKAIINDSAKKFGSLLECRTIHSLAYNIVKPSTNIENLHYLTIKEPISYEEKSLVIDTIDGFYRSASTDIETYAATHIDNEDLQYLVIQYVNMMLEGKIPPTFNFLLKILHLMLLDKEIELDYDLLILDECQDTTAVTLEIFKLINAKRKIMFGDKFQNIYSFMNTVNAFEELENTNELKLTKSFRCTPNIASRVQVYGTQFLDSNFIYEGNEKLISNKDDIAYISRTNASLIKRMMKLLDEGKGFILTRDLNEIFAFAIALQNASEGKPVFDKRYKYLQVEYKKYLDLKSKYRDYFDYIKRVLPEEKGLNSTCDILFNLKNKKTNIYQLKEQIENVRRDSNIIVTTAHTFKGLEADSVYIEDDLNSDIKDAHDTIINHKMIYEGNIEDIRKYLNKGTREELNLYYVALTRAKTKLYNVKYLI